MKHNPLSPHLTIYKPQITSVLSIAHRISGTFMFVSIMGIIWGLNLCFMDGFRLDGFSLEQLIADLAQNGIICIFAVVLSFTLFFHLFAGIRYLFWDKGIGMDMRTVNITGWLVICAAVVATFSFWYFF